MLSAFQWRLPDTYWQPRCRYRLVFEIEDLIEAGSRVDWQLICLGLEELLFNRFWYANSGLRNQARIIQLVDKIKKPFLQRLDAGGTDDVNSNGLIYEALY